MLEWRDEPSEQSVHEKRLALSNMSVCVCVYCTFRAVEICAALTHLNAAPILWLSFHVHFQWYYFSTPYKLYMHNTIYRQMQCHMYMDEMYRFSFVVSKRLDIFICCFHYSYHISTTYDNKSKQKNIFFFFFQE